MVAKISRGSSLYGALSYNHSKIDMEQGKILLSNRVFTNSDGEIDIHSTMQSFELHLLNNLQTEKPIVHISLNPHPDDILSDEQLSDIAQEYMEKMGYGRQPFVVYKHDDIERTHIHIVTTNVGEDGRKLDHNNDFYRSKQITRELEQKYGLHPADRKSREQQHAFNFKKIDATKGNVKIQIGNVIKPLAVSYKFQSFGEYRTLLAQYNICVEESKGVRNGRAYEGLIYYATNNRGEKVSNPFKSSLYGKNVGYRSIYDKCAKHKQSIKSEQLNKQTAQRIERATLGVNNRAQFADRLKEAGVDMVLRKNDSGRIYGVTFVDHNNHCVFNGSQLGKEFSANAFTDRFNNPQPTAQSPNAPDVQQQDSLVYGSQQTEEFSLGGLFDFTDNPAVDPDEERFRRLMQRKKKKGRKM